MSEDLSFQEVPYQLEKVFSAGKATSGLVGEHVTDASCNKNKQFFQKKILENRSTSTRTFTNKLHHAVEYLKKLRCIFSPAESDQNTYKSGLNF